MNYYEGNFGTTRHISKQLITTNGSTDSTFKGTEVTGYSIAPAGVAKATVNQKTGVVSFEKYDPTWSGKVTMSLQTTDGIGSGRDYINDYTVQFNGIGFDDEEQQDGDFYFENLDDDDLFDDSEGIEYLSEDEEEDTTGGSTGKTTPRLVISSTKNLKLKVGFGTSVSCAYSGDGKLSVETNNSSVAKVKFEGNALKIKALKPGTAVLTIRASATAKCNPVNRVITVVVS